MKKIMKITTYLIFIIVTLSLLTLNLMAHSGRTDSSGGHKDNKNKSGLGGYHYHHGYGAHLHSNGICPYEPVKNKIPATIGVENVHINSDDITLELGESKTLSANISPSNAADNTINWTSNNNNVVTVDSGVIKAIGEGSVTISAKAVNGKKDTIIVTVEKKVDDLSINEDDITLVVGDQKVLSLTFFPNDSTNKDIIWVSGDENIATVDNIGRVVAIKSGVTNISVISSNGKRDNITVTVDEKEVVVDENTNSLSSTIIEKKDDDENNNRVIGSIILGGIIIYITKHMRKSK